MDRLLTKEEQNILANTIDETQFETSVQYWEAILEVITQTQDAKTLKAVGKLLRKRLSGESCAFIYEENDLGLKALAGVLLRGEMPDET